MELPLSELSSGKTGRIIRLERGWGFQRNLRLRGIREGNILKVIASYPLRGPIVVEVDGREITVGRGMASGIIVEIVE